MKRLLIELDYTKYLVPTDLETVAVELLGGMLAVTETSAGVYLPDVERNKNEVRITWISSDKLNLELSTEELALVKQANKEAADRLDKQWAAEAEVSKLKKEIETLKALCPVAVTESPDG